MCSRVDCSSISVNLCSIIEIISLIVFLAFLEKYELVLKPQVKNIQDPMGVIVLKPADRIHFPKQIKKKVAVSPRNMDLKIIFCQNFGRIITSSYKECPTCFFPL